MHKHEWRFGYKPDDNYNTPGSSTPGFYCMNCGFESDTWIFLPEAERRLNATECLSAKMPNEAQEYETKPDLRCVVEELNDVNILPFGWVLLRRQPNSDPKDGFIDIKLTGDMDILAKNRRLLAANERLEARIAALEAVGAEAMDRYVDAAEKNDALYELEAENAALQNQLERLPSIKIADETVWLVFPGAIISIDAIGAGRGTIVKKNLRAWRDKILQGGDDESE